MTDTGDPHLPASLTASKPSGGALLVHRVQLIDPKDEVDLRHELPGDVNGKSLDPPGTP